MAWNAPVIHRIFTDRVKIARFYLSNGMDPFNPVLRAKQSDPNYDNNVEPDLLERLLDLCVEFEEVKDTCDGSHSYHKLEKDVKDYEFFVSQLRDEWLGEEEEEYVRGMIQHLKFRIPLKYYRRGALFSKHRAILHGHKESLVELADEMRQTFFDGNVTQEGEIAIAEMVLDVFCCQWCTKNEKKAKQTKAQNKEKSMGETTHDKHNTHFKYGTNWETDVFQIKNMSPSEIEDSEITRDVKVDGELYSNRLEWYKGVGDEEGFKFAEEHPIGKGGFGEVYKIIDIKTNEIRVLKVMRLRSEKEEFSETRFKSFKNEIFSLRKMTHKNIIKLFDHFMVKNWLSFMIMEYANEGDLKKRLNARCLVKGKGFPESEAKTYFAQIANAINFVHSNGLIHGDLKLENILISKDSNGKETIKVTDFGCARVAFKEHTGVLNREKASGTIIYMSPEQIRVFICVNMQKPHLIRNETKSYNPFRSDIWSLGVVLYRLLFNDYPFNYEHQRIEETLPLMLKAMKKVAIPPRESVGKFNLKEKKVQFPSDDSIDLVKGLLDYNKDRRIDMSVVMINKWLINCPELDDINQ